MPISVRFKVVGITEIKHWLLGFGATAKVLEPANLREEVSDEARALLDQYKVTPKKRPMAWAPIRRKESAKAQYQLKLKECCRFWIKKSQEHACPLRGVLALTAPLQHLFA